jgi:xyloglucan-specific exo-beta-1,4-glucanase
VSPSGLLSRGGRVGVWVLALAAALCLPLTGAAAGDAPAQPYDWRNVTVGAGGFAPNVIFSRAEPDLAYLRTDMGGAYRWDAREGRWIPMQDGNPVSSYMGVESIAADPTNPAVVYLAAGMGRWGEASIWRSEDRGATWSVSEVPFKMGGNEPGRGLGERLAIDPAKTSTLLFGSRHDGLQRSDDAGRTWRKVSGFPHGRLGLPANPRGTNAGISFVLFDSQSRAIFAAVADPAERHLYRSDDGGESWAAVPGGPGPEMLLVKGDIDHQGNLYIAYATSIGPNDIADGAVWRLDTRSGEWSDITPDPASQGGYMGLSVDRMRPGRLAVSSVNRWEPGDTVWLSENHGRTWADLSPRSRRDTTVSPFLNWGEEEADFGHWTAGLAIDPFDGGTLVYTTGATVYRTDEGDKRDGAMLWRPWVRGIEQTAVITLISPTGGAPVISGIGDLGGFVHDTLDVSPSAMHLEPRLSNTNNLDYAGLAPHVVVRSGTGRNMPADGASLAWSEDGGHTWQALRAPRLALADEPARRYDLTGEAPIDVSADGAVFIVGTPMALVTHDRGKTWAAPEGLPPGVRAIADKTDPQLFYGIDFVENRVFVSRDGARSFAPAPAESLPTSLTSAAPRGREGQWPMQATPGRAGELWFKLDGALYHSADAAQTFRRATPAEIRIEQFGLGHAAPDSAYPALYAIAVIGGLRGVWRSDDGGASWLRINDDAHQWGQRFRAISGDPRRYGRVYLATDGRGLLYGDPIEGERR